MGRKEEIGTELHPVGIGESPAMEQGGRREEREKKKKKDFPHGEASLCKVVFLRS